LSPAFSRFTLAQRVLSGIKLIMCNDVINSLFWYHSNARCGVAVTCFSWRHAKTILGDTIIVSRVIKGYKRSSYDMELVFFIKLYFSQNQKNWKYFMAIFVYKHNFHMYLFKHVWQEQN
jgi:hypothetical protein